MAAMVSVALGTGVKPCEPELFRVVRNTNANVVVYEARLSAGGALDASDPVHPVWIMLAEDGRREELNGFESAMAFGVELHGPKGGDVLAITIRARPDLAIRVLLEAGCPVARTRIAGREATLRLVSVVASGGIVPEVVEVELVGVETSGGVEVRERLDPSG